MQCPFFCRFWSRSAAAVLFGICHIEISTKAQKGALWISKKEKKKAVNEDGGLQAPLVLCRAPQGSDRHAMMD